MIAGLLFIPTTIFDMIWGVRFCRRPADLITPRRSCGRPRFRWVGSSAVRCLASFRIASAGANPSSSVSAVVLLACLAWILYGRTDAFPPYVLGIAGWRGSGAAMLPYTVIKEANPPEVSGTATGVVNFLNFTFSALLLGPCLRLDAAERRRRCADHEPRALPDRVSAPCCTASAWRSC